MRGGRRLLPHHVLELPRAQLAVLVAELAILRGANGGGGGGECARGGPWRPSSPGNHRARIRGPGWRGFGESDGAGERTARWRRLRLCLNARLGGVPSRQRPPGMPGETPRKASIADERGHRRNAVNPKRRWRSPPFKPVPKASKKTRHSSPENFREKPRHASPEKPPGKPRQKKTRHASPKNLRKKPDTPARQTFEKTNARQPRNVKKPGTPAPKAFEKNPGTPAPQIFR